MQETPFFAKSTTKTFLTLTLSFIVYISLATESASAERVPEVTNPGIKIYFCGHNNNVKTLEKCKEDYENYSWGSKINVLIFAPAWNTDPYKLDFIGDSAENPIGGYTDETKVKGPCKFVETDHNSGWFVGRVKLNGFRHDIDNDGSNDLFGSNACAAKSPLEEAFKMKTSRQGALTIFWKYAEDQVITKSAKYSWRLGTLEFDKAKYDLGDKVTVTMKDMDLERFPFDSITRHLKVWSDTDIRGIDLKVRYEFGGKYPASFTLTTDEESRDDSRLRVSPGDAIYVQYTDYSLPPPHSINDSVEVVATAKIASVFDKPEILTAKSLVTDSYGKQIKTAQVGDTLQILTEIANPNDEYFTVSQLVQVKNSEGHIEKIFLASNNLSPKNSIQSFQSWKPKSPGLYSIEVFVWDGLTYATPLAKSQTLKVTVS
ncbi:MAG: hypothetical protein FJ359_05745 [Thaumarchaeota archaeon]|nr:hypothetical protein [Nitrososphaerota archaeon]